MIQKRDSRGMILFCVFNFVAALFGLVFGGVFSEPLEVKADDPVAVDLTIEQTLALYGTEINGTWYSDSAKQTYPIKFHYGGNSLQWLPLDYSGSQSLYIQGSTGYGSFNFPTVEMMTRKPYLIYYAANTYNDSGISGASESDWGGSGHKWALYNGSAHSQLHLPFSISLAGISEIQQAICYSGLDGNSYNWQTPENDARYSYIISDFSSSPNYRTSVLNYPRSGYPRSFCYLTVPSYQKNYTSDSPIENRLIYLYGAYINYSFSEPFDYTGQTLNCCMAQALDFSDNRPYYPNQPDYYQWKDSTQFLYLLIQVPTLVGYTPPDPPVQGTGVTQTLPPQQTVDLSNLESGVQGIIVQGDNNNALLRTQIYQLNTIIEQLNAIYARMAESGEVAINLNPAAAYPTLNSNIVSGINQDITTHTVAQLPDMGNGAQAFNTISHELGLDTGIWLSLAFFTVGFSIFCWVVFRGRG